MASGETVEEDCNLYLHYHGSLLMISFSIAIHIAFLYLGPAQLCIGNFGEGGTAPPWTSPLYLIVTCWATNVFALLHAIISKSYGLLQKVIIAGKPI
jgi:hypothetical protein